MHSQRDDHHIPLKDTTTSTGKHMDSPDELPRINKKQCRPQDTASSEKKVHPDLGDIVPHSNDILLGRGGKNNMHVSQSQ